MFQDVTPQFIVLVCTSSFIIGLSKGGLGAVLVLLVTPLLSLATTVPEAVSTLLPLLVIADLFALYFYWKTWDTNYIRLLLPLAFVGVLVGTYLLVSLPEVVLRWILSLFSLIFIVYRLVSNRLETLEYHHQRWHGYLAGGAAGLGSALANNGAPPFVAYMLLQEVSPTVFVGTTTLFFAVVNALKVPPLMISGTLDFADVANVALAIPLIPLGVWVGRQFINRINRQAFEVYMLVILAVAAVFLLLRSPT